MNYKDLSDESRVWIYQSNREFSLEEVEKIQSMGVEFVQSWNSHEDELLAALEVFYNRFIVIFLDEAQAAASGCSIDKSIALIKKIESEYNCELLNRMQVCIRQDGEIAVLDLNSFRDSLEANEITAETIVFNNLVENKSEFKTNWEVPISRSWHAQMLPGKTT